jgi:LPXTG-motif cell wall-anchored protein
MQTKSIGFLFASKEEKSAIDESKNIINNVIPWIENEIYKHEQDYNIYEKELDNMSKTPPGGTWESRFDIIMNALDTIESQIAFRESQIQSNEDRLEILYKISNKVERKINRFQRRAERKANRLAKIRKKEELRALYGKGSDYRKAKREAGYGGLKQAWEAVKRVSPPTVMARNGMYLILKLNIKKLADRIRPAYMNQEQIEKYKVTAKQLDNARKSLEVVESVIVKNLGGTKSAIKSAVLSGKQAFNGLGAEPISTATLIASGLTSLGIILTQINKLIPGDPKPDMTDIDKFIDEDLSDTNPAGGDGEMEEDSSKTLLIVGGLALATVVGILLMKRKNKK